LKFLLIFLLITGSFNLLAFDVEMMLGLSPSRVVQYPEGYDYNDVTSDYEYTRIEDQSAQFLYGLSVSKLLTKQFRLGIDFEKEHYNGEAIVSASRLMVSAEYIFTSNFYVGMKLGSYHADYGDEARDISFDTLKTDESESYDFFAGYKFENIKVEFAHKYDGYNLSSKIPHVSQKQQVIRLKYLMYSFN
jgi:hypothetical protein